MLHVKGCYMAVVVKAVLGSHFGLGAPPILVHLSGDWDAGCRQKLHLGI